MSIITLKEVKGLRHTLSSNNDSVLLRTLAKNNLLQVYFIKTITINFTNLFKDFH